MQFKNPKCKGVLKMKAWKIVFVLVFLFLSSETLAEAGYLKTYPSPDGSKEVWLVSWLFRDEDFNPVVEEGIDVAFRDGPPFASIILSQTDDFKSHVIIGNDKHLNIEWSSDSRYFAFNTMRNAFIECVLIYDTETKKIVSFSEGLYVRSFFFDGMVLKMDIATKQDYGEKSEEKCQCPLPSLTQLVMVERDFSDSKEIKTKKTYYEECMAHF